MLGRLKDAHSLLDKHVETSNRLQESEVYTALEYLDPLDIDYDIVICIIISVPIYGV